MRPPPLLAAVAAPLSPLVLACGGPPPAHALAPTSTGPAATSRPDEPHLANLRQLTFGGENAEAYWSWGGDQLILQARGPGQSCDRPREPRPPAGLSERRVPSARRRRAVVRILARHGKEVTVDVTLQAARPH